MEIRIDGALTKIHFTESPSVKTSPLIFLDTDVRLVSV